MRLSAIICSHNPRIDYLRRVLEALKAQTLPIADWELLVIDNASSEALASQIDLSWHSDARCLREEELGLTPARLRGIKEARAELLVFVDDDNVLSEDYFEQALRVSREWPTLGAWGGQLLPEFEREPAAPLIPYLPLVGVGIFEGERWSNLRETAATPCGAGMCIRRRVALAYAEAARGDQSRLGLDRRGSDLASAGDTDMAFTACDLGYGTGQFSFLRLQHLIPARRLELPYLLRLRESMTLSQTILLAGRQSELVPPTYARRLSDWIRAWTKSRIDRAFRLASQRGRARAFRKLHLRSRWF
jgi:glycosyltransferase involved in cell wall biosynthesis